MTPAPPTTRKRLRPSDVPPELRTRLSNGCGGSGSIFRLPRQLASLKDCNEHDVEYAIGGSVWERLKADLKMLVRWTGRAFSRQTKAAKEYRLWGRIAIAFISFLAVRLWGWKFWHYGEPRDLADLESMAGQRARGA